MGNREVVERFAEALANDDFDAMDELLHDDYVARWPQSGEMIHGRANRRAVLENYPGGVHSKAERIVGSDDQFITGPSWNIIHLVGSGDEITMTGTIDYGDLGVWHFASLLTLRDGKIWRQTDYFAAPFNAPAWRAQWVEVDE